jgi:hypothetical protein
MIPKRERMEKCDLLVIFCLSTLVVYIFTSDMSEDDPEERKNGKM